jgi:C4-dicarboxylate transporter DctQ subunit
MPATKLEKVNHILDEIEETSIAICLGLMTLITFANVLARYVFETNILWALELTSFLFAWLVLMGVSYGVKTHIHIGIDVVVNMMPPAGRKIAAILSVIACLSFSIMLLIGSWDYWYPFANERSWLETEDIPLPEMFQFLSDWLNEGERYDNVPRMIPYLALPLGVALMTLRFIQVGWQVLTGEIEIIIACHEAESDHCAQEEKVWK